MSAFQDRRLRDDARRYLLRKRMEGLEVAYRIDGAAAPAGRKAPKAVTAPPAPEAPAAAPAIIPAAFGAPAAMAESASIDAPAAEGASAAADSGIRLVTSPLPFEAPASIRYRSSPPAAAQGSLFGEPSRSSNGLAVGSLDMTALEKAVSACTKCSLSEGRTRTVFGSGSPRARIVFVGEAPGREEDLQGLPFVGRAGQLLTKMLAAIGLGRDEVYIANILKCRPPGNRQPAEEEMRLCEPYLARQLELIDPLVICALGLTAAHGLLKRNASLGALRQGIHYYNDIRVAVTYHPAALLRNPNLKRDAWEDLQAIRRLYDEALKESS